MEENYERHEGNAVRLGGFADSGAERWLGRRPGGNPASSNLIFNYTVTGRAGDNGKVYFTAEASAYGTVDRLGFSAISIYDAAGNIVKTVSSRYASNARSHSYTTSYDGTPGEDYRAYVCYYAKDGSAVDDGKMRWSAYVMAQ